MDCKALCGFFGTEARNGYCSKCFNNGQPVQPGQFQQQYQPQNQQPQQPGVLKNLTVVDIPEGMLL